MRSDLIMRVRRRLSGEQGVTLVESIVSAGLLLLVLVMLGGIIAGSMSIARDNQARTAGTQQATVVAQSVQGGLNDTAGVLGAVQTRGRFPGGSGGQTNAVVALTRDRQAGTWTCRAWAYDPGSHTVWERQGRALPTGADSRPQGTDYGFSAQSDWAGAGWTKVVENATTGRTAPFRPSGNLVGVDLTVASSEVDTTVAVDSAWNGGGDEGLVSSTCRG